MDHASARGRGIGKTAFLSRRQNDIAKDLGASASESQEVVFALHVVPPVTPPLRKFWELARHICDRMVEAKVFLQAMCRMRAQFPDLPEGVIDKAGEPEQWPDTIGSDAWLRDFGFDTPHELSSYLLRRLRGAGVREELASKLAHFGTSVEKLRKWMIEECSDNWWRVDGGKLLFDDVVKVLREAGFTRGLLLVDEVEKIILPQNSTERRNFVEALRYFLIDGTCESAKRSFYGVVLTIHPGIQSLLLQHWKTAGLDRSAPLHDPDVKQNEISFGPLKAEDANKLILEYLNYFRLNDSKEELRPFTNAAIQAALVRSKHVPGPMLNLLHNVIEGAIEDNVTSIDEEFVKQVYDEIKVDQMAEPPVDQLPTPTRTLLDSK
ncbi:MAG TPA: hypothetical protein PLR25_09720 [Planctomycetaceae bacterium]|nr:hypothetical protein [Planctomycetaceae bacterium]